MTALVINGDTSGSVTLAAPAAAGSNTITLPTVGGTIRTTTTSGTILQIVQATYQGETSITTATFTSTGLSGTITPTSSTSKIYLIATGEAKAQAGTTNLMTFFRNGSNVVSQHLIQHSSAGDYIPVTLQYLDSPASTSAQTYTVYFRSASGNPSYTSAFGGNSYSAYPLMTITMIEVAA